MQRNHLQWESLVVDRIAFIRDYFTHSPDITSDSLIIALYSSDLISDYYDSICLSIDLWYIFGKRSVYAQRRFASLRVIRDPVIRVAFGIVVQALCDAQSGRPCDAHSWRLDRPPGDGARCTPTVHICVDDAVGFVHEIAATWEPFLSLRDKTLVGLLPKKTSEVTGLGAFTNHTEREEQLLPEVDLYP